MSKSSFKLRSGNSPLFKLMGSSPMKNDPAATHPEHHEEEEIDPATGLLSPPAPNTPYEAPDIQEAGPAEDEEEEEED